MKSRFCYMDRPADTREGYKHRCTNAAMEYFKSEVMEMCHREGLYQIDLLNGSKERITEREYWAAKKGQLALDKENAAREAAGQPTKPTKFETDKAKLRRTIRQALSQATSFDEFSSFAAGGCDRQGEPGAAFLPHTGQDKA